MHKAFPEIKLHDLYGKRPTQIDTQNYKPIELDHEKNYVFTNEAFKREPSSTILYSKFYDHAGFGNNHFAFYLH